MHLYFSVFNTGWENVNTTRIVLKYRTKTFASLFSQMPVLQILAQKILFPFPWRYFCHQNFFSTTSANYISVTQQLKLKLAFMWTFNKIDLKLFRTIYNIIWLIPPFNLIKTLKKKTLMRMGKSFVALHGASWKEKGMVINT